jgi:O-antigen/teichoic acid export membrane protein
MLQPFDLKFTINRSEKVLHRLFSFSLMSGISDVGSQIFSFADRMAVGAVLGLDAVAYYTIIISIAAKILQLSGALTSTLMPAVSTWMASGDIRRVRAYFLRATASLLGLNFFIASILIAFSAPLLRLWMGEAFTNHILVPFRILILIYALISLNAPAHFIAYGMGLPWINALGSLIGGVLTITLILWLGKSFGLLGVSMANSGYLFIFVLTIIMIIYFQHHGTLRQ